MKNLSKLFPLSYKVSNGNELAGALTIYVLGYYAGNLVTSLLSFICNLLSFLPDFLLKVLTFLIRVVNLLGGFVTVYSVIGFILAYLVYRKITE